MEFFAGAARASLAMKSAGYTGAKLDILYFKGPGTNYYDLLTDSGMASGAPRLEPCHVYKGFMLKPAKKSVSASLRVAIACILKISDESVCYFGLKCSSFSIVNRGTSKRTPCTPSGDECMKSVVESNTLAARTGCVSPQVEFGWSFLSCHARGQYYSYCFQQSRDQLGCWNSQPIRPWNGLGASEVYWAACRQGHPHDRQ